MLMLLENNFCMLLVAKSLIEHLLVHSTVKKREEMLPLILIISKPTTYATKTKIEPYIKGSQPCFCTHLLVCHITRLDELINTLINEKTS